MTQATETAMTNEQSAAEVAVKIRSPRYISFGWFIIGGIWLFIGGSSLALDIWLTTGRPWTGILGLVTGCISVANAFWFREFGVDLTPETANIRGLRHRSVPWGEVQAVVHHRRLDTWCVRLILESGEPVTLRAPTTSWGFGRVDYERDFHRIGQWWLAHRGESWRPACPEAPEMLGGHR
jgi:hypothetical protein